MIFGRRRREREVEKLKLYVEQLEQLYSNLLREKDSLKRSWIAVGTMH